MSQAPTNTTPTNTTPMVIDLTMEEDSSSISASDSSVSSVALQTLATSSSSSVSPGLFSGDIGVQNLITVANLTDMDFAQLYRHLYGTASATSSAVSSTLGSHSTSTVSAMQVSSASSIASASPLRAVSLSDGTPVITETQANRFNQICEQHPDVVAAAASETATTADIRALNRVLGVSVLDHLVQPSSSSLGSPPGNSN